MVHVKIRQDYQPPRKARGPSGLFVFIYCPRVPRNSVNRCYIEVKGDLKILKGSLCKFHHWMWHAWHSWKHVIARAQSTRECSASCFQVVLRMFLLGRKEHSWEAVAAPASILAPLDGYRCTVCSIYIYIDCSCLMSPVHTVCPYLAPTQKRSMIGGGKVPFCLLLCSI